MKKSFISRNLILLGTVLLLTVSTGCTTKQVVPNNNLPTISEKPSYQFLNTKPLGKKGVTTVFDRIVKTYPGKIRAEDFYLASITRLANLDPKLRTQVKKNTLKIFYDSKVVENIDLPSSWKLEKSIDWIYTTVDIIKRHSSIIAATQQQDLEFVLINSSLKHLDYFSAFYDLKNNAISGVLPLTGLSFSYIRNRFVVTEVSEDINEIYSGDVLEKINGVDPYSSFNITFEKLGLINNEAISLTVKGEDNKQRDVLLPSDVQPLYPVELNLASDELAILKLRFFAKGVSDYIENGLKDWHALAGNNAKGLVIDIRGNSGGLFDEIIALSDLFLSEGIIVSVQSKGKTTDSKATPKTVVDKLPIVVLIDAGTTNGAEVFAAALKDNQRAVIVGSNTLGQGKLYTIAPLTNGTTLAMVSGLLKSPKGMTINNYGIEPHVCTTKPSNIAIYKGYSSILNTQTDFCKPSLHLYRSDANDTELEIALDILLGTETPMI